MTKNEILEKIRAERPTQNIHEVLSFNKNEYGFFDVLVDMETSFCGVTIAHSKQHIPYPLKKFQELDDLQMQRWENYWVTEIMPMVGRESNIFFD